MKHALSLGFAPCKVLGALPARAGATSAAHSPKIRILVGECP